MKIPRLPYVTLPHRESSSFLSFIFVFGKIIISFLLLFFKYESMRYSFLLYTILIWITSMNCTIPLRDFL